MQTEIKPITLSEAQMKNVNWWEENPMTYDWEGTL